MYFKTLVGMTFNKFEDKQQKSVSGKFGIRFEMGRNSPIAKCGICGCFSKECPPDDRREHRCLRR